MMAIVSSVTAVGAGFPQRTMSSDMSDVRKPALEALDVRGSDRVRGEGSSRGFTWLCVGDHGFGWDSRIQPMSDFFIWTGVTMKEWSREKVARPRAIGKAS